MFNNIFNVTDKFEWGMAPESQYWLYYLPFLLIAMFGVAWLYRRDTEGFGRFIRYALTGLRWVVYIAIFLLFMDPRDRNEEEVETQSRVIVVGDISASMQLGLTADVDDASDKKNRRVVKMHEILGDSQFAEKIRAKNDLVYYALGTAPEPEQRGALYRKLKSGLVSEGDGQSASNTNKPADIDPEKDFVAKDTETRLGDGLASIINRESNNGVPISGVIYIGDGRLNVGASVQAAINASALATPDSGKVPIYSVALGYDNEPPDVRLADLQVPPRVFKKDKFNIEAVVTGRGLPQGTQGVEVMLQQRLKGSDASFTTVETKNVKLKSNDKGESTPESVKFELEPDLSGADELTEQGTTYEVRVAVKATGGTITKELDPENNKGNGEYRVVARQTKVMLFAGGPSRDYQFIRNLLYRDKTFHTSILLQTRGDKLSQEADKLLKSFPETRTELFENYDVIVGIDPDWAQLSKDQKEWLVEWVDKEAGGLILVAGHIHTPSLALQASEADRLIPKLYPVKIKTDTSTEYRNSQANPIVFTPSGASQAFLQLADDPEESKPIWEQFEGFYWTQPVEEIKPGAQPGYALNTGLETGVSDVPPPIFCSMFYGSGLVFYIGSGEMWRIRRLGEEYYDRFWVQTIRHVGQGALLKDKKYLTLLVDKKVYRMGERVNLQVRKLVRDFLPDTSESVSVSVVKVDGDGSESQSVTLPRDKLRTTDGVANGWFVGSFDAGEPGKYVLTISHNERDETLEKEITVKEPELEFDIKTRDLPGMRLMATETGGKVFEASNYAQIADLLEDNKTKRVITGVPDPHWDELWVLIFIVTVLSIEWLSRKLLHLA